VGAVARRRRPRGSRERQKQRLENAPKTPGAPGWKVAGTKEAAALRASPDPPRARLMEEAGRGGEHSRAGDR
jgi:hypothetical protein